MSWTEILNHDSVIDRFRKSIQNDRLASTYLFVGPEGIGKRTFALKLAESLLCETTPEDVLEPCGTCPGCQQVRASTHPDLIQIAKPKDKAFIPLETFIGDKEHRRREGLCHDIGLKPFRGGRKIAIIDDADFLNQEGANSLLKTLEEPPPKSVLILLGTSEKRQLKTIVSRSQVIRFDSLTNPQVLQILSGLNNEELEIPLDRLANTSNGSVQQALKLAAPMVLDFRKDLMAQLATLDPGKDEFNTTIIEFVDAAGKDNAKKRARLAMTSDFAISFFRELYLELTGVSQDPQRQDEEVAEFARQAASAFSNDTAHGIEIAARCIERCTQMHRQIYANANAPTMVDAWLRDLAKIARGELIAV